VLPALGRNAKTFTLTHVVTDWGFLPVSISEGKCAGFVARNMLGLLEHFPNREIF
jgi:hypothetical protein